MFYYPDSNNYSPKIEEEYTIQESFLPVGKDSLHFRLFKSKTEKKKGIVLFFHGNAQNLTAHWSSFSWLIRAGYDYAVFDYRGYGLSSGEVSRESTLEDGVIALDFAHKLKVQMSPDKKLIVIGQSLGGAVLSTSLVNWLAINDSNHVDFILLDATFPGYQEQARSLLAQSWITYWLQPLTWMLLSNDFSPQLSYEGLEGIPKAVSHCEIDAVVPFEMGEMVFSKLPEPKVFWKMEKCGHGKFFHPYLWEHRKGFENWLDGYSYEDMGEIDYEGRNVDSIPVRFMP